MINKVYALSSRTITWGVLGIVRSYATIESGKIISKTRAGAYALEHFDNNWQAIIHDALEARITKQKKYYRNPFKRRKAALEFMEDVLEKALKL